MSTHTKHFYSAIGRSLMSRYVVYAANLVSLMLLARMFTPQDFGVVASVAVISAFFQMMAEGGLAPAVINLASLDGDARNGMFSAMVLAGAVLAALFVVASPLIGSLYRSEQVLTIVPFLAVTVFFNACAIVPTAFLQRDQKFSRLALAGTVGEIVSTTLAILSISMMPPLYALASKAAWNALVTFVVQMYSSSQTEFGRPRPGSHLAAIKVVSCTAAYQLGANFATYLSRNMDNVLVGRVMGPALLGVYDKAYQLMRYPLMLLTFAMTPAIQPAVRKYASEPDRAEAIHRDFTFRLSMAGVAVSIAICVMARPIVLLILGTQWLDVVPLIKILAISVPAQVVLSTNGSFFQAMGRPDLMFATGLGSAIVMVAAILVGICSGNLLHLCWALVVAFNINFVHTYVVMYLRVFKCKGRSFLSKMAPACAAMVAMALCL